LNKSEILFLKINLYGFLIFLRIHLRAFSSLLSRVANTDKIHPQWRGHKRKGIYEGNG